MTNIRAKTSAFSLLELTFLLALLGLFLASIFMTLTSSAQKRAADATAVKMQAIDAALLRFTTEFNRLPCPADLAIVKSGADYGAEAGAAAGGTGTGECVSGMTPAANHEGDGVAEGAVPTRALGLPVSFMVDGWNNRFRYAVDINATARNAFTSMPANCTPSVGTITINASTGEVLAKSGIYALISHGPNGHGAYDSDGEVVKASSDSADELVNCHCTSAGVYNHRSYTPIYVQKLPQYDAGHEYSGAYYFDDIVTYKERWQLHTPLDAGPGNHTTGFTGPASGSYSTGQALTFAVDFLSPVAVTGTPRLHLAIGGNRRYATYAGGSGTSTLTFAYTVVKGDSTSGGISVVSPVDLNGGSITTGGCTALITFNAPMLSGIRVNPSKPDMTIAVTGGPFTQGTTGNTYTLTAKNSGNAATSGIVTVVDTLPVGLTATALSGTGWSCNLATLTCSRSDPLSAGAGYPAITLTVNVAANASSGTNTVTVSGGGEINTANDSASDPTTVNPPKPDMTITVSGGPFTRGTTGNTYTLTAKNSGGASSSGTVTVADTLFTGLTATAMSGTGWNCNLGKLTCSRFDALSAGASYPAITLTVNAAATASSGTNVATVSGGGETNTTNDRATDPTTVNPPKASMTIGVTGGPFTQGDPDDAYTITVKNSGSASGSGIVTVVDRLPAGLRGRGMSGMGWSCNPDTLTCSRSDALSAGASYPAITLTVDVASNAFSGTDTATVSGGGATHTGDVTASNYTHVIPPTHKIRFYTNRPCSFWGDDCVYMCVDGKGYTQNSSRSNWRVGSLHKFCGAVNTGGPSGTGDCVSCWNYTIPNHDDNVQVW